MRFRRTVGTAAASALCALGLAVTATAAAPPPDPAEAHERSLGMPTQDAATSDPSEVTISDGASRADVPLVASDPAMVWGKRWAAEAHRLAQSMVPPPDQTDGVSFGWREAGAGALAALGLIALLGVGAYGLRARSARPRASAAS